jgi:hypothetical protein
MKVVYTIKLPFMREGRPVGARFETEEDFVPYSDMEIMPTGDIVLYVESYSYNPHDKTVCVELTFVDVNNEDTEDLNSRDLAELEISLEELVAVGWLPINQEDLINSSGEPPERNGQTH